MSTWAGIPVLAPLMPVHQEDTELAAGRKLAETVRRWTSDHASNGKPCHCRLCSALARYDQETAR